MRRILCSVGVIVGLLAWVAQPVQSQSQPTKQASPAGRSARSAADRSADEAAIRANIEKFVKAYNDGDAKAVAALFTPDGHAVDQDGNDAEGRKAIEQTFADLFAATPKKNLKVFVESIQFVGPDLALEVGTTKETPAPGEPPEYD